MSEDGFSDCFDEPNMEIQIDTLMGTSFDMRVSSMDTVGEIKQRIQRVEGIPIHQQNLIFQSKELKDSRRLCDVGIKNGSIIKLVTAMKGGPISTRRLSVSCEHHMMLKELKELLENTRDEIGDKLAPGSKVSVLVFKEGDILNLLRVIENEDGSYSPYSEKPISPPSRTNRRENQMTMFEKLVEDTDMMTKISNLRKNMDNVQLKRQLRTNKKLNCSDSAFVTSIEEKLFGESSSTACAAANSTTTTIGNTTQNSSTTDKNLSYKLLAECTNDLLDNIDLKIFEKNFEEEYLSETEEIALKDKHRIKNRKSTLSNSNNNNNKSLYSESKGAYSHTKQNYARIHKKTRDLRSENNTNNSRTVPDLLAIDESPTTTSLPSASRSTVHLTRLVLSEGGERPKSSDSIEIEEKVQDLWEIHEPASDRLKHSATCKFGLLKRRQSLDYGFEGIENTSPKTTTADLAAGEFNYCNNSDLEVCSGNIFHVPQIVSSPSAIPPQYAPKEPCDYFLQATTTNGSSSSSNSSSSSSKKSPLYGRNKIKTTSECNATELTTSGGEGSTKIKEKMESNFPKLPEISHHHHHQINKNRLSSFLNSECSSIQRLRNEHLDSLSDSLFSGHDENIDELYGYYNLGCATEFLGEKISDDEFKRKIQENLRKRLSIYNNNKKEHGDEADEINIINSSSNSINNINKRDFELPPVIKKKARCNECNKRLNITNIYNCRCGKIFCSQHRYSEVHRCSYDYKTEGRRILEHQNPLVAANKINKI